MNDERTEPPPDLRAPFPEASAEPAREAEPAPPEIPTPPRARGGGEPRPRRERPPRPELLVSQAPVFREVRGYRLRMEPPDLARLRELPGSRGRSDDELGAEFLESQEGRLLAAISGDVAPPVELRVLVDPYSRQAFLAAERRIKGIVSF